MLTVLANLQWLPWDEYYRLELPPRARIHNVFHVGLLKKYHGPPPEKPPGLPAIFQGRAHPTPHKALQAHLARECIRS